MSLSNIPQKQLTIIRRVMFFTGLVFIGLSTFLLTQPEMLQNFIELDDDITQILSYAFLFIGVTDIILSLFIFRRKNKT